MFDSSVCEFLEGFARTKHCTLDIHMINDIYMIYDDIYMIYDT